MKGIVDPASLGTPARIDCDVVVVGTGAGGGAVAAELAEGGLGVLAIEEGPLADTETYSADLTDTMTRIMRDGGTTVIMGRSPVPYLEGRCVGGSTVINGGMCWRTPPKVLHRWRRQSGLEALTPEALEPIFERVEERIGARRQDPGSEGGNNAVFRAGCEALGWRYVHNLRAQVHCVGANECATGCPTGAKQSTLQSYVRRMLASGGRLLARCRIRRILLEGGRVTGVAGVVDTDRDPTNGTAVPHRVPVEVHAKAVVIACGAIQTPLLLQRNRLWDRRRHLGRHFTIHPNAKVIAEFDEPVDSLRGTHQAYQCTEFHDEGLLLAPGGVPPSFLAAVALNDVGARLQARMERFVYLASGGVLVDDSTEGWVRTGPWGVPRIHYDVSPFDQARFIRAVSLLAEIYFAAGARAVYTPFRGVEPLRSPDDVRRLFDRPPPVESTEYFTAHLMGTARMHADPDGGVVDVNGAFFGLQGLYLADASVLPGTLGVNPQETIMALATRTAFHILDNWDSRAARA